MKRIFLIIIMIGQVAGCSFSDEDKIEKLFEKAGKPESFELLYQDEIDHGLFVLYIDDSGLNHAIYSDKMKYWNVSGNSDLDPKDGFNWGMTNDPHIPIATFAGVITNDEIKKVVVRLETLVNEAVVITTTQGRFWYTYFDDSIESIKDLRSKLFRAMGILFGKTAYTMESTVIEGTRLNKIVLIHCERKEYLLAVVKIEPDQLTGS